MDLRIEGEKEKGKAQYLVGFTVDHQIKGIIKEPITTLAQAKEWQRKSTHSKVNLNTGEWAKRKKKGQKALVNVSLVSQRKKPAPVTWMTMEGVTEVGAIGGSKQFPGVFNIVDKGVAEYGAKKVYMLEIWLWGKVFNGRFLFRELSIKGFAELKKLAKEFREFSDEEEFNELAHDLKVLGDDGFEKFYGTETLKGVKMILGLPEDQAVVCFSHAWREWEGTDEFWQNLASKIKQALEATKSGETLDKAGKPLVLPVAETAFREELNWFFIKPLDQIPYAISDQSVKKKWVPPEGYSCLPKHVRNQIPTEYRYWRKGLNTGQRLEMRDALVEKMKSGEVKIDIEKNLSKESEPTKGQSTGNPQQGLQVQEHCYCSSCDAVYRHVSGNLSSQPSCPKCGQSLVPYALRKLFKARVVKGKFVYQLHGWRGPKIVRRGFTRLHFDLRLKIPGEKYLRHFTLEDDLLEVSQSSSTFKICKEPEAFIFEGYAPPGHFLNPTADTPAFVEKLDGGDVLVYQWDPEFRKFELKGEKLKGLFIAVREDPKSDIWVVEHSELPKTEKSEDL